MTYLCPFLIYSTSPNGKNDIDLSGPVSGNILSGIITNQLEEDHDEFHKFDSEFICDVIFRSINYSISPISKINKTIANEISERITSVVRNQAPNWWTAIYGMDCILLHVEYGSSIIVISETKEDVNNLIRFIKENLNRLNEDTDVHSWHLVTRSEFAQLMSSEVCTEIIERKEPDQLEESVSTHISSMVAPSVDNNVSMKFDGDVVESTEFDILLHLSQYGRIYVEVKDSSHQGAKLTKSDVVTDPLDNARRLRRYTAESSGMVDVPNKTSIVVVVKGMEERRYQDLKPIASNRNIHLLQYDENGAYTDAIADIAVEMAAEQTFNWN